MPKKESSVMLASARASSCATPARHPCSWRSASSSWVPARVPSSSPRRRDDRASWFPQRIARFNRLQRYVRSHTFSGSVRVRAFHLSKESRWIRRGVPLRAVRRRLRRRLGRLFALTLALWIRKLSVRDFLRHHRLVKRIAHAAHPRRSQTQLQRLSAMIPSSHGEPSSRRSRGEFPRARARVHFPDLSPLSPPPRFPPSPPSFHALLPHRRLVFPSPCRRPPSRRVVLVDPAVSRVRPRRDHRPISRSLRPRAISHRPLARARLLACPSIDFRSRP